MLPYPNAQNQYPPSTALFSPAFPNINQPTDTHKGLSCRHLKRLPLLSIVLHTKDEPCTLEEVLSAMEHRIETERAGKAKQNPTPTVERCQ